jgi:hypothetical protein
LSAGTSSALTPVGSHFTDSPLTSSRPDWTFLPHELQFYLGYFYDNITNYHYGVVNDEDEFFKTGLTGLAIRNEALLYAVVGFSAYHHALKNPNGKINDFLQYYSRSVTLLLDCLKKKEKYSVGTLFTILQLGTIEVSNCVCLVRGGLGQANNMGRNIWATGLTSWAIKKPPSKFSPSFSHRRR